MSNYKITYYPHCSKIMFLNFSYLDCVDKSWWKGFCPFYVKANGHCNEAFYQDYCAKTCGFCGGNGKLTRYNSDISIVNYSSKIVQSNMHRL